MPPVQRRTGSGGRGLARARLWRGRGPGATVTFPLYERLYYSVLVVSSPHPRSRLGSRALSFTRYHGRRLRAYQAPAPPEAGTREATTAAAGAALDRGHDRGKGYLAVRSAGKGSTSLWGQPGSGSLTIHPKGETCQAASEGGPQARWGTPGLTGAEICPRLPILLS